MKSEFGFSNLLSREFRMCSSPLCKPYVILMGRLTVGFSCLEVFCEIKKKKEKKFADSINVLFPAQFFRLACYFNGIDFSVLKLTNKLGVFCLKNCT